jgi:hypothetical protein
MKRAIGVLLGTLCVLALAQEPNQPQVLPEGWQRTPQGGLNLPDGWQFLPDGKMARDGRVLGALEVPRVPFRDSTCYYIRALRPVLQPGAPQSGFIPLQSRITSIVSEPVCAPAGALRRAVQPAAPRPTR